MAPSARSAEQSRGQCCCPASVALLAGAAGAQCLQDAAAAGHGVGPLELPQLRLCRGEGGRRRKSAAGISCCTSWRCAAPVLLKAYLSSMRSQHISQPSPFPHGLACTTPPRNHTDVLRPRPCPCLTHDWAPVLDDVAWHKPNRPWPAWFHPHPTTPQPTPPPAQPQPRSPTRVGLGQGHQDLLRLVPVLLLARPGLEGGGLQGQSPGREAGADVGVEQSRCFEARGLAERLIAKGLKRNLERCQEGQATGQGQVAAAQRCLSVFSFTSFCQAQRVRGGHVPAVRGRS